MSNETAPPHGVMSWKAKAPTIGMQSCQQAEQLWRCLYWKRQFGASHSTQAIKA